MSIKVYFASVDDTPIATPDPGFIRGLKSAAARESRVRVVERASEADLVLVDEVYQYRTWHYRDALASCSFVKNHAEHICVINHDSYARVFLPGLYASLDRSMPPLVDAASAPYKRDLWQVPVPEVFLFTPSLLFTFRGTYHTHRVREKMSKKLTGSTIGKCEELRKAFHDHSREDQRHYIREILGAKFSLCPRGLSPSSYRLYESMQLGRCPVVISDYWIPPTGPRWNEFLLRVPETELDKLEGTLQQIESEAKERGQLAQSAWQEHFSWPARYRTFLNLALKLHAHRDDPQNFRQLCDTWHSREFLRTYNWTIIGRAKQRLGRALKRPL